MVDNDSPALQLLKIVWRNVAKGKNFSWRDVNGGMQEAMELAIRRGLVFNEGDMQYAFEKMRGGYWFGVTNNGNSRIYGEWFYAKAIEARNTSAYKSFEKWQNRKPFIIDGQRLFVRARFIYRDEQLTVTSFSEDGAYLVACKYKTITKTMPDGWEYEEELRGEVERVIKITHADIYAWNKERRDGLAA